MKKQRDLAGKIPGVLAMTLFALALALLLGMGCAVQQAGTVTTPEASPPPLMVALEASSSPIPPTATLTQEMTFYSPIDTPTVEPTPTEEKPTPTPTAGKPTPTAPGLDDYVFGEPQVVLTHTAGINIAEWLPDSENLLITRSDHPNSLKEFIETFNVRTGELRRFGERHRFPAKLIWLDVPKKVAFTALTGKQYDLWISGYGDAQARQSVFHNVDYPIAGGGNIVVAVPRGQRQMVQVDGASQVRGSLPIDLAIYGFDPDDFLTYFRMAWHPGTEKLAVFDLNHFVLIDTRTNAVQEIDLGTRPYGKLWAHDAEWSPDGRYLAVLITVGRPILPFVNLAALDTSSGELHQIDLELQYLNSLAWAPNSRYLATVGQARSQEGHGFWGLYLVDISTGEFKRILPDYEVGTAASTRRVDWSPNGQILAVACPTWEEGRLCLIKVSTKE